MLITTLPSIECKQIKEYLGIVSAALLLASLGGNKAIQRGWKTAVDEANELLITQAKELNADAIIGIRYEPYNGNICATGTAVKFL